jgi:hypothetical protein
LTWKIEGNIYFYTTALKIMARVFLFFPLLKKKKKNHPPEEENGKSRVLYTRHCAPPNARGRTQNYKKSRRINTTLPDISHVHDFHFSFFCFTHKFPTRQNKTNRTTFCQKKKFLKNVCCYDDDGRKS